MFIVYTAVQSAFLDLYVRVTTHGKSVKLIYNKWHIYLEARLWTARSHELMKVQKRHMEEARTLRGTEKTSENISLCRLVGRCIKVYYSLVLMCILYFFLTENDGTSMTTDKKACSLHFYIKTKTHSNRIIDFFWTLQFLYHNVRLYIICTRTSSTSFKEFALNSSCVWSWKNYYVQLVSSFINNLNQLDDMKSLLCIYYTLWLKKFDCLWV